MKETHVNTSPPYPTDKVTDEEVKRLPEGYIGTSVRYALRDTLFHMGETILTRGLDESYEIMYSNFWIRKGGRCPVEELVEEDRYYQAILNKIYEEDHYRRKEQIETYEAMQEVGRGDTPQAQHCLKLFKSPWNSRYTWNEPLCEPYAYIEHNSSLSIEVVFKQETNKDD